MRLISEISSLSYDDAGMDDEVNFGGSNVLAFGSANASVSAGTISFFNIEVNRSVVD